MTVVSFVMSHRMLRGIRDRAEEQAGPQSPNRSTPTESSVSREGYPVTVASRHGSTGEIAARIAEGGCVPAFPAGAAVVEVVPAAEVGEVAAYDAVVLGSAGLSGTVAGGPEVPRPKSQRHWATGPARATVRA